MNKDALQSMLLEASMNMFSPLIRSSLLNRPDFINEYNISVDAEVSFGGKELAFKRSVIFPSIRKSYDSNAGMEITSTSGKKWLIEIEGHGDSKIIILSHSDQRIKLQNLAYFAPEADLRLLCLENVKVEVNLPDDSFERWKTILSERALDDEELNDLFLDIDDTPVRRKQSILSSLKNGRSTISDLVPVTTRYYERLIGSYEDYNDIAGYASSKNLLDHFKNLLSWDSVNGFLFSLLMSAHSSLGKQINSDSIIDSLPEIFGIIRDKCDLYTQLGSIELGFSILEKAQDIEPIIEEIIQRLIDVDVDGQESRYNLFAAIVVLVDGELARRKIFSDKPPFWRRLASFTQAGLIESCMVESRLSTEKFPDWAYQYRGNIFYMQSLVDLLKEPRWQPDLISPEQLRAEVIGRIANAAQVHREKIKSLSLAKLLLDKNGVARKKLVTFPYAFLPGPLEGGGIGILQESPDELQNDILDRLNSKTIDVDSFNTLINSALVFKGRVDHANLAAKAIQSVDYQINNLQDIEKLMTILSGLATVAASTRSTELANVVRVLMRRCLREKGYKNLHVQALRIGMVCAAAFSERFDWREFAGDWITEIAYSVGDPKEVEQLHIMVKTLLDLAPELWLTCGKAEAALLSIKSL